MRDNNCRNASSVKQNIKRQKVWIDTKVINMQYSHGHNYAKYGTFHDDEAPDKISIKRAVSGPEVTHNIHTACFAGLLKGFKENPRLNRMYSTVYLQETIKVANRKATIYDSAHITLEPEECVRWIELAKQYQLLPGYVDKNCIKKFNDPKVVSESMYDKHSAVAGGTVIFDVSNLVPSMLYVYLSTLRNLREDPGFVRTSLYFIDILNMNFFAAYIFASCIAMSTSGHHIIPVVREYVYDQPHKSTIDSINGIKAHIKWMISLQRFIKDPSKYDKRNIYDSTNHGYTGTVFDCSSTISKVCNHALRVTIDEVFDPDVVGAIMSSSDKVAKEYIESFEKIRPRIKYKEAVNAG